jgi:hypothetical protein
MVYIPPQLNRQNFWYNVWNTFPARGYIRFPLVIGGAYVYHSQFVVPNAEAFFKYLNKGNSQSDLWNAVEERTKLRQEGKWGTQE